MTRMNEDIESQEGEYVLIRRILGGDRELFRTLVQRYQDLVFGMVMRQVGDRVVAEDISQEVFLRAFRGLRQFKNDARFSTWIVRIALNQVSTYFASAAYRQKNQSVSFRIEDHDRAFDANQGATPEVQSNFQGAIAALSPKLREVLVLCGLEGMSYEEVSQSLKIPVGTVRSRLNSARLQMRSIYMSREVHDGD